MGRGQLQWVAHGWESVSLGGLKMLVTSRSVDCAWAGQIVLLAIYSLQTRPYSADANQRDVQLAKAQRRNRS